MSQYSEKNISTKQAWGFVPTSYFMEGLPFTIIIIASTVLYKNFGFSNSVITLYTSSLLIPWGLKPLWSWLIDITRTKRWWIITMQIAMSLSYIGIIFSLQTINPTLPHSSILFFKLSIAIFWVMAFFSSTHDIAVDGFYLVSLSDSQQSYFVGMQRLFYQLAKLFVTAILLTLVGTVSSKHGMVLAWSIAFGITGVLTLLIAIYHLWMLPKTEKKIATQSEFKKIVKEIPLIIAILPILLYKYLPYRNLFLILGILFIFYRLHRFSRKQSMKSTPESSGLFTEFFKLEGIWITILFIFTFRVGENFVSKVTTLFLLDSKNSGGLGLSTTFIGFSYSFVLIGILLAGILGGMFIYRYGVKKVLWIMYFLVNIPHLIYIYMAYARPTSWSIILLCQIVENFVVTFALAVFTMILFYTVRHSRFKTSHFAFLSAINIIALMLPSMYSGYLQQLLGYQHFFIFVQLMMIPCAFVIPFLKIDSEFGKKINHL